MVIFVFSLELHLLDGSIIRDRDDALAFLRAQEARPGVDDRDGLLHAFERVRDPDAIENVASPFRDCLRELEILDERKRVGGRRVCIHPIPVAPTEFTSITPCESRI